MGKHSYTLTKEVVQYPVYQSLEPSQIGPLGHPGHLAAQPVGILAWGEDPRRELEIVFSWKRLEGDWDVCWGGHWDVCCLLKMTVWDRQLIKEVV